MQMTEKHKEFARCIIASMEDREMSLGVGLMLQKDEEMHQMIDFLQANLQGEELTVTDEDILEKAVEIHQQTKKNTL